ncbi:glycosyl hydrolase [Mucilaginibacter pocheonensis]|uniref:Alpha-L-rhamnosidase n=1 Tax=Mucilaginibacter pocheonensis TaxID=398050 RepID=A0ABU1TCD0_9SPHI|nr:glycosyl hydrolase [Mucilaginibacter pocheonensis]MDR6942974.1 hypothetical protein [Mucilaginibacter pocheonensis]
MSINRRRFLKLGSVTIAGLPLARVTQNTAWYNFNNDKALPESNLYKAFKDPVNTAKPFVRWWWNGNRIVKEELLRELDMLKGLGIGGVEINSIRFPETADPLHYKEHEWLSDEWLELLDFALKAANERGMICDIIVGSGWPFGGEFLTKDEQTQIMALGTKDISGPQTLKISREELLKIVDPPISSKNLKSFKELCVLRLAPANLESIDQVVNLDSQTDKDLITIDVPDGNHVLYFLVKITGFMAVMFGAPGASGPVLNHYNKEAVQKYLNKMSDAITPKIGLMGNKFRSVFTDSLELEGANWCDDMLEQFEKRRKYSLNAYLPFILFKTGRLGRALDEKYGSVPGEQLKDTLDRVRYDFEITKMELFQERFLDTFLNWCKTNGVKSRVQAYGREYHPSDSSMQIDVPECETWIRTHIGQELKDFDYKQGRAYSEVNKFVSSGARLAGKKLISCEEITNTELVFNATLERIKQTGDQSNLSGVTHSILHGFNYSPADARFPGWIRYGTFFNERNPWWPYLKQWVGYKGRLSAVFQNGTLVSDVAVMHPLPDLWSKYAAQWDPFPERALPSYVHNIWEAIHQNGSGCDYVSESVLQKATFLNGKLVYGPRQYKALLIVEAETIHPNTAKAIKRFADAGGRIIFIDKYPYKAPGYNDHLTLDKQVNDIIKGIKNKNVVMYPAPTLNGKIIDWYKNIQERFGITPYMKIDDPQASVSQVYYKFDSADAFFISNYSNSKRFEFNADFNVTPDKTAWLWDAETGERYLYPTAGKKNRLKVTLGPAETKLIVFDLRRHGEKYNAIDFSKKAILTVTSPWNLTLNHVDGSKQTQKLDKLIDFKDDHNLAAFAGDAVYENSFIVNNPADISYLNLGKVEGVSKVILNGKDLGNRWYGDHVYAVKGVVKKGSNLLIIQLATTLGNYMYSLKDNKDSLKWIRGKKQPLYTMGVLGPVELG